ncbi:hypothetical protein R3P38DRAFT_1299400 [Favolaschia claudopus]|uniref:Uncharacterized protein n=1 Tax=Favolaschia claudopus TaxID=2862362 RepID=A0AAW0AXX3_9AGAR
MRLSRGGSGIDTPRLYTPVFCALTKTPRAGKNLRRNGGLKTDDPGRASEGGLSRGQRGDGVDYAEREGSYYLAGGNIREDMAGKTWKQFKAHQDRLYHDEDDDLFSDESKDEKEEPVEVKKYGHVDEYACPPLHFKPLR